jgi:hypothetical protein
MIFEFLGPFFGNHLLVWGAAAAAAPVLIHLAHRRRLKRINWGAMRLLSQMMARSRRRLFLDEWLLLLIRILILLTLALALMRPRLPIRGDAEAAAIVRQGPVAAVVLIDDGLASGAGRGQTALDDMKELAAAYVRGLKDGDEISILRMSQLSAPAADPIFDRAAAEGLIRAAMPTDIASDAPALIEAGLTQLARHVNADVEIVLVTDGAAFAWKAGDRARWAPIRRRFDAAIDPGRRPRLIVLAPGPAEPPENLAVSALRVDRALTPPRRPVSIRVEVRHTGRRPLQDGRRPPEGALLRLAVDGRTVDERPVHVEAGARQELNFTCTFAAAGSHVVEATLEGARDALARDDRRALVVDVVEKMPVLLVEGDSGSRIDGSLGLFALALNSTEGDKDLFHVTRIPLTELPSARLDNYRVVVLGDVPALDASLTAAVERFVAAGGSVLAAVGPRTDVDLINRLCARGGDGFFPAPIARIVDIDPPATASASGHPAMSAFRDRPGDIWKDVRIRRCARLDLGAVDPSTVSVLASMNTGDPLIVLRRRGLGSAAVIATSLDDAWSDLPSQAVFVPLVREVTGFLGGTMLPPRNVTPGDRLSYIGDGESVLVAEGPDNARYPLKPGAWEGRHALVSEPALSAGVYKVVDPGRDRPVHYAVALDPEASALAPLSEEDRRVLLAGLNSYSIRNVGELHQAVDPAVRRPVELWPWLVAASILLLFLETWITRRQSLREERAAAPTMAGQGVGGGR